MSESSEKPKVMTMWCEQTEKLKKKLESLMDRNLYFEQGKMDEMLSRLQNKTGKNNEIYEITKI
jgi:hypothetical protein